MTWPSFIKNYFAFALVTSLLLILFKGPVIKGRESRRRLMVTRAGAKVLYKVLAVITKRSRPSAGARRMTEGKEGSEALKEEGRWAGRRP